MKNNIPEIKTQVTAFFGRERVNELLRVNVLVLHQSFSAAYNDFRDTEAEAYRGLITLRNLMIKEV